MLGSLLRVVIIYEFRTGAMYQSCTVIYDEITANNLPKRANPTLVEEEIDQQDQPGGDEY